MIVSMKGYNMTKTKKVPAFIVYSGPNEVLVTTPALEAKMLKEWFGDGVGRDLDNDWDRSEGYETALQVVSDIRTF